MFGEVSTPSNDLAKSNGISLNDRIAKLNQEIEVSSAIIAEYESEVVATNRQIEVVKQQLESLEASVGKSKL